MSTPQEVIALAASEGAEFVDVRFTDVPGVQHHFSMPIHELTESVFEDGLGFDGSSVSGFQTIDASDMLLIPDPDTALFDPFMKRKTLVLLCDVKDPVTGEMYGKDPRGVVRRSLAYMASTGIADQAYFGPEAEFFIFDSVAFQNQPDVSGYQVRSAEGIFESGRPSVSGAPSPGHRIPYKGGYFPLSPMDTFQDLRSEMVVALESVGIPIEVQHHEVGTAGQAEIDMVFDEMLVMADKVQLYKYVVKNVAREHGRTVTFMPKPIYGDNGSGMHTHMSLWMNGETLMYDERGYAGLSDIARWYIGGLLAHAPAILAFAAPTTNSYKRLVPGYEAPVNLAYSQRNRSAAIRIPLLSDNPKAKRLEFRCPDPSANPYLAFAAMLMAGLDGVQNQMDPGDPLDKNIYDLPPEEAAGIETVPGSLSEALAALEADQDFLLAGDVFNTALIESYLEVKQEEVDAINLRPHPLEYEMYYSV